MANERNFLLALAVVGIAAIMLFQTLSGLGPLANYTMVSSELSAAPVKADVLSISPATQILKFKSGIASTDLEIYSSAQADVKISVTPIPDVTCRIGASSIGALKGSQTVKLVCTARGKPSSGLLVVTASSRSTATEAKIYLDSGN
ncbi:Uncharacterised protein [Candidatus Gugararchaeum adminiculabundum]|nr:Uncharacterised protein [Candidatus Gugararchaeum adminiculabundum]